MLFVVCCLLFDRRCLVDVDRCALFVVCCLMMSVGMCRLLCAVCVRCFACVAVCLLLWRWLLSAVGYLLC